MAELHQLVPWAKICVDQRLRSFVILLQWAFELPLVVF